MKQLMKKNVWVNFFKVKNLKKNSEVVDDFI